MAKSAIPKEIKLEVQRIVDNYNHKNHTGYLVSFRGNYCYLSRIDKKNQELDALLQAARKLGISPPMINQELETETKIGRLEWTGEMDQWDFTVYRYSRDRYDPDEWFFPGSELLDGTIEGAMKAGHEIYP